MVCPICGGQRCRRSRRRSVRDFVVGLSGVRPWRCHTCEVRFYGWQVPTVYVRYAHCSRCGNLDLQRIGREHVTEGWFLWPRRLLHFRAYRCAPCRYRFFSLRPQLRGLPHPPEPVGGQDPVPPC